MEATTTRSLMQKVYHENCPGCKQEQRSDGHVGIPYREFFCICVLTLCYGDHVVFFALNVATLVGIILTFKPFLTEPSIKIASSG